MTLKPSDIEQKTFSTALRGYDLEEVDDFLDEIVATITALEEQLEEARSAKRSPQSQPSADPVHDASAVGRALITAQVAADRILAEAREQAEAIGTEAREEAERIRAEARTETDRWISERDAKRAEAEAEMAELSRRVDSVRRELAVLATAVADGLDQMDATIGSVEEPTMDQADGEDFDGYVDQPVTGSSESAWGDDSAGSVDPIDQDDEDGDDSAGSVDPTDLIDGEDDDGEAEEDSELDDLDSYGEDE